jgi:DNA-binding response OmpR family regulator
MSSPVYRVLVVDDDEDLIDLLARSLARIGNFAVTVATDGAEGLECFYNDHPDCMVIDVVMPRINGPQLVRALRGDPESSNIPIVMLTALATQRAEFVGLASGADVYLTKPITPQALAAAVRDAIARSAAERVDAQLALLEETRKKESES